MASWREPQILRIPRVTNYLYRYILHADYQRTSNQTNPETGYPFFFEGEYSYRIPVDTLPIDRKAEAALKGEREGALPLLQESLFHNEFAADRLRGGGPLLPPELASQSRVVLSSSTGTSTSVHCDSDTSEDQERIGCIASLSVGQWNNRPVYSMVEDDDGREMLAVGFIHEGTSPLDKEIPETVGVEVHYLQKLGYISPPQMYPLDPEETFLIEASAPQEAVAVLQKLEGTLRMTEEFMQGIRDGYKLLGTTPDGREIVWITGDPTALYVMEDHSNLAMEAKDYSSRIASTFNAPHRLLRVHADTSNYCCPWGCSVATESPEKRYALSFASLVELHQHCSSEHTYGEARSAIRIRQNKRLLRITEGNAILKLCADVAAAVVALFPDLQGSTKIKSGDPLPIRRLPSGIEFSKSPTGTKMLLTWSDAKFRENLRLKALLQQPRSLQKVLNLWLAIGCVFECEVSGRFRLSKMKFESMMYEKSYMTKISAFLPTKDDCCQFVRSDSSRNHRRFQGCSLCSLPWETCVGSGAIDETENTSRGLGCVLRSDVSFNKISPKDTSELHGKAGEAKELLLQVATLIQEGLRSKVKVGALDPLHGDRLWDEGNYKSWETFVAHCTTPRMFSQALVVLMGSIDKSKMPRWWKQEGAGWSTFQSVMANANMDAFFLQLYVLDAALSETIGRSLMGERSAKHAKKTNKGRNTQQEMDRWLTFAMELPSFASFIGQHGNECLYCDDGGELLCCELCQNVAHAECCDPVIEEDEITRDLRWICDSCINDICQRKGIARENLNS